MSRQHPEMVVMVVVVFFQGSCRDTQQTRSIDAQKTFYAAR